MHRMFCQAGVVLLGTFLWTGAAVAQDDPTHLTFGVKVGASEYDLGGHHTAELAALLVDKPLNTFVVVEGSLPILDDERSASSFVGPISPRVSALLPEVSLQLELPLGLVRPYVGGGPGAALRLDGPGSSDFTAHVAGGIRVPIARHAKIQAEVRRRFSSKWAKWTMDYTLGVTYWR